MDTQPSIAERYFSLGGANFIGLGFYWAWLFITFYTSVLLPPSTDQTMSGLWNWAAWAHALTLITCALLARRLQPYALRRSSIALSSLATLGGTLLIPLGSLLLGTASPVAVVLATIGALVTGVTTAWLVLAWSVLYSRRGARFSLFGIIASYLLAALIFFLVQLMSSPIAIATTALMPVCSAILLYAASLDAPVNGTVDAPADETDGSPAGADGNPPAHRRAETTRRFAPRLILPLTAVLLYALCGEVLRGFATAPGDGTNLDDMGNLYLLGSAVGVVVMGIILTLIPRFAHKKPSEMPGIRVTLLIMAAGFLVATLTSTSFFFAYAVFGAAFQCFRALVWMYSADVTERTGAPAFAVFGASQGCAALAVVLGVPIASSLNQAVSVGAAQLPVIASVAVFLIFTSAVLVVNPKDLETAWGLIPPGAEPDTATRAQAKGDDAPSDASALCEADAPSGAGAEATSEADAGALSEAHALSDARDGTVGANSGASADDPANDDALSFLSDTYGLTARESEVARLLAKGRSLPFIQEELHIAQGTAQTHLVHIYRKLGVHSRQEFLDVVESQTSPSK